MYLSCFLVANPHPSQLTSAMHCLHEDELNYVLTKPTSYHQQRSILGRYYLKRLLFTQNYIQKPFHSFSTIKGVQNSIGSEEFYFSMSYTREYGLVSLSKSRHGIDLVCDYGYTHLPCSIEEWAQMEADIKLGESQEDDTHIGRFLVENNKYTFSISIL